MIRSFIRYLKGTVRIRVEGYSPERFLNLCSYHQIEIRGLRPAEGGYELEMGIADFRRLKPLVRKSHVRVILCGREGFPFFLARNRKRKLFFAGIFLCAALVKICSLFIWDIHFEGNRRWPDETLAEFLRADGVAAGMLKSRVDCPGIVKEIRKAYNDIVWVSASLEGSRLNIRIKENEDADLQDPGDAYGSSGPDTGTAEAQPEEGAKAQPEDAEKEAAPASGEERPPDLVAAKDGVVPEIVTRSGVPQVHAGDEVEKGDILVLGRIEVVNDSQEVTGYEYVQADADIFADTQMEYTDTMSLTYQEKVYDGKRKVQAYVRLNDTALSVGSVKNRFEHSELLTRETGVVLGENFRLPVSFGLKTARSYTLRERKYTEREIRETLTEHFNRFCEDLEEKGIQILKNDVKIHVDKNSAAASGTLWLNERITEEADTEILTIERKEIDESVGTDD